MKTYIVRCFFRDAPTIKIEFLAPNDNGSEYLKALAKIVAKNYPVGQDYGLNFHGRYCDVLPK